MSSTKSSVDSDARKSSSFTEEREDFYLSEE